MIQIINDITYFKESTTTYKSDVENGNCKIDVILDILIKTGRLLYLVIVLSLVDRCLYKCIAGSKLET